jgi:hypothetical protein
MSTTKMRCWERASRICSSRIGPVELCLRAITNDHVAQFGTLAILTSRKRLLINFKRSSTLHQEIHFHTDEEYQ